MGKSKQELKRQLKSALIEGDGNTSPALGAQDPRHRRGPQRASDFGLRYDAEHFEVDENGRVTLRSGAGLTKIITKNGGGGRGLKIPARTKTVPIDWITWTERDDAAAGTITRGDGLTLSEIYGIADESWLEWYLPTGLDEIDRTQSVTVDIRFHKRESVAGKNVSFDIEFMAWEAGESVQRARDQLFQIVDHDLGTTAGDDTSSTLTITSAMYGDDDLAFRFHLTRVNSSAGPGTLPGIHGVWVTYTTKAVMLT